MISRRFVTDKVKGLVLFDRSADGAAILVRDQLRLVAGIQGSVAESHGPGLQMLICMVFEGGAVKLVRSTSGLDVDSGAPCQALFRVKTIGYDIDLLDRFQGRDVGDHGRELDMCGGY